MRTAVWLAEEADVSPAAITKYETQDVTPSPSIIAKFSELLEVPQGFFFKAPHSDDAAPFLMRSLASSTKRARDAAKMKTVWLREMISFAAEYVAFPSVNLPELSSAEDPCILGDEEIEDAALRLRSHWGMREGPIVDLTGLLEANGVVISRFAFGANKFDAFSKWPIEAPIIVDNTERCTAVRLRFDLSHELGHLVLHRRVPRDLANRPEIHKLMEKQAHRFAGAFLFPARPFASEVYTVALAGLVELKKRWGMSAQAMIYRAHNLSLISDGQAQRAFRAISASGFRTSEPLDDQLVIEEPGILASAFESIAGSGYRGSDIATALGLNHRDIEQMANLPAGFLAGEAEKRDREEARVIPFRKPVK